MFGSLKKNGILDPEGKYKNPLTGDYYSEEYYEHTSKWENLPVYLDGNNERLIKVIKDNRVLILESGTGSGKTVLVPKYCLHALNYKGKVMVTVPKRKIARDTAVRDAEWMDVVLGEEVGYLYMRSKLLESEAIIKGSEYDPDYSSHGPNTKLLFATGGSLVSMLNRDPKLTEYDIVVIDEAHERSMEIDESLLYMRRALHLNRKLKIVVMSATLPNSQTFLDYFKDFDPAHEQFPPEPNKPIEVIYLPKGVSLKKKDESEAEIMRIIFDEIIGEDQDGDILVFVNAPTQGKNLATKVQSKDNTIFTAVLSSTSSDDENDLATHATKYIDHPKGRPHGGWSRRIVFATNVAESSITVYGLIFVIDSGTELKKYFNSEKQQSLLMNQMITKAQADQRKGRVGRVVPGVCYRLYTKQDFNRMKERPETTVMDTDLTYPFLKYLSSPEIKGSLFKMVDFVSELMDPPPKDNVLLSIKNLISLGLVSVFSKQSILTEEGKVVSIIATKGKLPDVGAARAILAARHYGCEKTVMILAAIISVAEKGISVFFDHKKPGAKAIIKEYQHKYGDLFSFYNLYMEYHLHLRRMDKSELQSWARKRFIKLRSLETVKEKAMEIFKGSRNILEEVEVLEDIPFKDTIDLSFFALLHGYFENICRLEKSGKKPRYTNFYPPIRTTASFDTRGESYFSLMKPSKYAFYISNFSMDGNVSFKIYNACPAEMIKSLTPEEKKLLPGLKI
jgi:HrpA-like RNA helicase